jgi:hypothetical protein
MKPALDHAASRRLLVAASQAAAHDGAFCGQNDGADGMMR